MSSSRYLPLFLLLQLLLLLLRRDDVALMRCTRD